MHNSLPVYYDDIKLILEVPESEQGASFPDGAKINAEGQNNTDPVIVVQNPYNNGGTWQGADAENGVVIVDNVTHHVCQFALNMLALKNDIIGFVNVLAFLEGAGYNRQRTITKEFVNRHFIPVTMTGTYTGVVLAEGRPRCDVYKDKHGTLWLFDGTKLAPISSHMLKKLYTCADGSPIKLDKIPLA